MLREVVSVQWMNFNTSERGRLCNEPIRDHVSVDLLLPKLPRLLSRF